MNFYWLIEEFAFRKSIKVVHSFVDAYIAEAQDEINGHEEQKPAADDGAELNRSSILYKPVDKGNVQSKTIRDQLLNLLLASRDTTANLLKWTIYLLARKPVVLTKLRKAITGQIPGVSLPTAADIKEITYLRWKLNEVLRLYPLPPLDGHTAARFTTLARGGGQDQTAPIVVTAGTKVAFCIFATLRREDIFGEDADEFWPERWGEERAVGSRDLR